MKDRGATALTSRGVTDVTEGNVIGDFDTWLQDCLWPAVSRKSSTDTIDAITEALTTLLHVPTSNEHPNAMEAQVVDVKALTEGEPRPKYHMEVKLPTGTSYEVGDYLEVYPNNTKEDIGNLLEVMRILGYGVSDPLKSTMHPHHELHQPASSKVINPPSCPS